MMELILQWLAGLAGLLLILYKTDSYALIIDGVRGLRAMARVSLTYLIYSFSILLMGTIGNLLTAYCLLHLFFTGIILAKLLAGSAIMIIFACLPEKTLKWLRWLHEAYMEAKNAKERE